MAKLFPGLLFFLLPFQFVIAQVPDRLEKDCLGRAENVYHWLDKGMPLLVFSMDYHCNPEDKGRDLARIAGDHRDDFRVWVGGLIEGDKTLDQKCVAMNGYLEVTTLDRAPVFAFIDSFEGSFSDPNSRTEGGAYFTVVGVERNILYEGDDLEAARVAALAGKTAPATEILERIDFASYPTMTQGIIKMDIPESSLTKVEVVLYNSQGQVMLRNSSSELNLSGMANGIYYLHLMDAAGEILYSNKHILSR